MANLTPEQLARMRQAMQGGQEYYDPATGRSYMPNNTSGWAPGGGGGYSGEDSYQQSAPTELRGYDWAPGMYKDNFDMMGTQYDKIDPTTGEVTGQGTWDSLHKNGPMDYLLPLAMVAAPFALTAMGVAGAGAGAGYGALGATEPVASIGAAGGMTQAELAALGAGGSGAGVGGAGYGALGASEPIASIGATGGMTASELAAMGGGGSSLASTLGGAAKWLGPAATLLGAVAGAKGQKTESTSERKTDPRVDPYLFGNNDQMGLLGYAYNQLARDQSPERLAQRDQMRSTGMGLLNQPIAGNGFTRFFPGR